ncbi:GGDEF domain-containing protein [Catenovulum sp. SM1970]|uniref:GGDEF domain-containing protein n=1 Tax=Marinifaba aquimaris TaxID=2741323 RepID=UPI001573F105|nr:GGDEF domain-containing protein [Marinifaba aquimaris]NTS75318.1 GGDEF domain-containing protein [Marinifaba aquimaris]
MTLQTGFDYEPIIELTSQVDVDNLHRVFIRLILETSPGHRIRLYSNRMSAAVGRYELIFNTSNQTDSDIVEKDTQVMDAIINETESINDGLCEQKTILPIMVRNLYFGFLFIENIDFSIEQFQQVSAYSAIYANQLNLLRTNNHDPLTGLLNRQTFNGAIEKLILKSSNNRRHRDNNDSSPHHYYAMLDIDNFKRLNDKFGHLIGDEVLLSLAQLMQQSFREDDLLFRYGGEEFAVLLKNIDEPTVYQVLERFCKKVADNFFPQVGHVTISIGCCQIDPNLLVTTIIERADKALYFAKSNGKNQVCNYDVLVAENKITETVDSQNDIELF